MIADPGGRRPSSWRTYRLCLESAPADRPLLVLQDDALPCSDFYAKTLAAIERHPDVLLALFLPGFGNMRVATHNARRAGKDHVYIVVGAYVPVVALCYPTGVTQQVLEFTDAKRITPNRNDDGVLGDFARGRRMPVVATVPSLVEHLADEPSAIGSKDRPGDPHRRACWYEP